MEKLSDEELFKLLPVKQVQQELVKEKQTELTSVEKRVLDELWKRHYDTAKKYLRTAIYGRGSTLCPPEEPVKEHFLHMCLNEAYPAFLRRTWRDEYENFAGYLSTLTLSVALDVRKQLTKKRPPRKNKPPGRGPSKKARPAVEMVPLDDSMLLVDEGKKSLRDVAIRELREIFEKYAEESPQNALSMRAARLKRGEELSWREIAETLLPAEADPRPLGARMKKLRDFEKRDTTKLLPWLRERNITDPSLFEV